MTVTTTTTTNTDNPWADSDREMDVLDGCHNAWLNALDRLRSEGLGREFPDDVQTAAVAAARAAVANDADFPSWPPELGGGPDRDLRVAAARDAAVPVFEAVITKRNQRRNVRHRARLARQRAFYDARARGLARAAEMTARPGLDGEFQRAVVSTGITDPKAAATEAVKDIKFASFNSIWGLGLAQEALAGGPTPATLQAIAEAAERQEKEAALAAAAKVADAAQAAYTADPTPETLAALKTARAAVGKAAIELYGPDGWDDDDDCY